METGPEPPGQAIGAVPRGETPVEVSAAPRTIFTVGHSNHPIETLLSLLASRGIQAVADVRTSPYSSYATHFDKGAIDVALRAAGIRYVFLGDSLGGRPDDPRCYDAEGRVLYGRVAESPVFQAGIERLLGGAVQMRVALLCGEEDPAGCHRRLLIGRVLGERGVQVIHLRGDGRAQTEEELARDEEFRRTGGQLSLFDTREPEEWKSIRSVSPKKAPPSSSDS